MSERKRKERVYLDHAAATPLSARVREEMERASGVDGNPSSLHREGREAQELLSEGRRRIARAIGAEHEREIILTGSGSEANALALFGIMRRHAAGGRGHLIHSSIEHASVLKSAEALAYEGYTISRLQVTAEGFVREEDVLRALRPETALISVMHANNEIGTIEPVAELAEAVRSMRAEKLPFIHTDACQAPGYLPLNVQSLGVDLLSLNASKAYGPKGIGALYVRDGVALQPLIPGEQWEGRRGGTESVALALGFAAALEEAEEQRLEESRRLKNLQDYFFSELRCTISGVIINGSRYARLPNNIHVTVPNIEGESIVLLLDEAGIACSTGSACNSLDLEASHVLLALGQDPGLAHGSVRFSMGKTTTRADIDTVIREFARVISYLRGISSLTVSAPLIRA